MVYDGRKPVDPLAPTMTQIYRVRYSLKKSGLSHLASDIETIDLQTDLEHIPEHLPPEAYIMYIENLTVGQNVHWTRWPLSYRPGCGR